jgi:hypothetical protein
MVNLTFLGWYLFVGYQAGFHSDSAAKVILAREIVEMGDYFPDDWNYVNNDLFVLFGHTFVIPLLVFMPAGYTAHAISGLISSVLILSGIWLLTSIAHISTARRLLVLAIVAAGISGFLAENLYGQVSYGAIIYFACFSVYFSWRFIEAGWGKKWPWSAALLVVISLAFFANPLRALVSYGIPLLAAVSLFRLKFANLVHADQSKSIFFLIGIVFIGMLIGTYLHMQTISGVNNVLGAGHALWLSYELMVRNISLTIKGFLAIFGGLPSAGSIVISAAGIYEASRLVAALSLLVLMPIAIIRTFQHGEAGPVFFCIYALVSFMAAIFLQLTTSIPDMSDPIQSSRYLVPSLVLLMILVLLQPIDFLKAPIFGFAALLVSMFLVTSAYPAFISSGPSSNYSWGVPGQRHSQHQALIDFLVKSGLHYGYASYWNAGSVSVLSNELVLVRQVVFEHGIPMPMRHLSSNRWYRPSAWKGETFLLLTSQEAKAIDRERLASYQAKPDRELSFGDYTIYVFAENISKSLPGWDQRYHEPATFTVSKHSLMQTGRFVETDGHMGAALVAEKGQSGALHFGPYVNVEPGRYVVTFDVLAKHNPDGSVRLDVAAAPDQKLFGEKLLLSSDRPQEIDFTLDKVRTMEFRVWALGNEQVVFKGVTIKRIPDLAKIEP